MTDLADVAVTMDFLAQVRKRVGHADMASMRATLERRSTTLGSALSASAEQPGHTPEAGVVLLGAFLCTRRRRRTILEAVGVARLSRACRELVGEGDLESRVEAFTGELTDIPGLSPDNAWEFAWELLHCADPGRYSMWTSWLWNPDTETGALKLLVGDDVDLFGVDRVDTYRKVSDALAVVEDTACAIGATDGRTFGVDVFAACVYGVYMYTVLGMRMSQEFNQIVPELPDLARRLLGIYRLEV